MPSFIARTTPWDNPPNPFGDVERAAWSPTLGLWVAVGANGDENKCILSSPDGIAWTERSTPADPHDATLYAAKGGSAASGLYVIDSSDGSTASTVGPTGLAFTGMAFDDDSGVMYGVTSNNLPGGTAHRLYTIDLATGACTLIGDLGQGVPDITYFSGLLYGWSLTLKQLCSIDPATAVVTSLGGTTVASVSGGGIQADGSFAWTAYEDNPQHLELWDLTTGTLNTDVGGITNIGSANMAALAFDEDGNLQGIALDSGVATLVGIDTGSAAGTVIGSMDNNMDALAWAPANGSCCVFANDVCWSPSLGLFLVAMQGVANDPANNIITSPDGINWTAQATPWDGFSNVYAQSCAWSESQGLFVVGASHSGSTHKAIMTSPDGVTWTEHTTPFDSGTNTRIWGVAYSPTLDLWVATAINNGTADKVMTSPDGATWTARSSTFDNGSAVGCCWSDTYSKFFVAGSDSGVTIPLMSSGDGTTWASAGVDVALVRADDVADAAGTIIVGGADGTNAAAVAQSATGGAPWTLDTSPLVRPVEGVAYSPDLEQALISTFNDAEGEPVIATLSFAPPPPAPALRFYQGFPWRFLFATIPVGGGSSPTEGGISTSWADGLLTDRSIAITLNQPTVIECAVNPDNRQVNELFEDGYPRVAQSNRVIYAFRREGRTEAGGQAWFCRAAAILMSPEDQGDADVPLSHLVAYDPWKYLEGRPVTNSDGSIFKSDGSYAAIQGWLRGDQIVTGLLKTTIVHDGFCFIDAGVAHGGTSFYEGTIEATPEIAFQLTRGQSIAEVWTQLCDLGNLDIVLSPIYDPVNRPGYTHELNVYNLAGTEQHSAVFGWDRMNRATTTIDRAHDGTPGSFVNRAQWYAGTGGFPVPLQENLPSVEAFLSYWSQQMYANQELVDGAAVEALAAQELVLRKQGLRTVTLNPTPERSPIALMNYGIGDRVFVYASKRIRAISAGRQRVQGIPIVIDDDGIEHVNALLLSPDYRGDDL